MNTTGPRRFFPYAILAVIVCAFFWQLVLAGRIPIDSSSLYEMRPWSRLPGASEKNHPSDWARYYHNIDGIVEVLPLKSWLGRQLRNGDLPLWIPHVFSGAPFAANHHAAPWDFSSLLFLLLPADVAFGWTLLLQLLIAGAGMYFYCRTIDLSPTASLLAATAFQFNSFFFHWLGLISFNAGLIWMPLIPAGIELAFRRHSRYLAITGLGLGMQFLSGMAQFWIFNIFLFLAYGIYRLYVGRPFMAHRRGILLCVAAVLGLCVGAVQLFQTVPALQHTSRGGSAQASLYAGRNHLSPRRLPTLLIPDFYGKLENNVLSKLALQPADPLARGFYGRLLWGEKGSVFNRTYGFIGTIPLLLALLALRRREYPFLFFRSLAGGVLLFQIFLCWKPFHDLCRMIWSGFDTLDHTRTIILYSFGAAVLAGAGLDSLLTVGARKRLTRMCLILATLVLVLLATVYWMPSLADISSGVRNLGRAESADIYAAEFFDDAVRTLPLSFRDTAAVLIYPALLLFFIVAALQSRAQTAQLRILLLTVSIADLFYRGWTDPPLVYSDRDDLQAKKSKMIEFLKQDTDSFRVYELNRKKAAPELPLRKYSDLELYRKGNVRFFDLRTVEFVFRPNTLLPYDVDSAGGYMSLYPGRYKELWHGRGMDLLKVARSSQPLEQWNASWIGMQNIKYILAPEEADAGDWKPVYRSEGIQVLQVDSYCPRIHVVQKSRTFSDPNRLLSYLKSSEFRPGEEVLLEEDAGITPPEVAVQAPQISPVRLDSDRTQFVALLQSPAFVVIAENDFPGWKATVNGKAHRLLRANYSFLCLPLEKGRHEILLEFEPESYKLSLFLSGAGGLTVIILLIPFRAGARKSQ